MRNLIPYKDDCFEVHKRAVDRKQKGNLKDRLLSLNPSVEREFNNFYDKFNAKKLSELVPNPQLSLSKDDLLSLYNYQSSVITSVREKIRQLQIKTIISTCQNCTIDSANTLDHILPKSNFPEFVVNPKNLFPCCATCNSYKLAEIGSTGQVFLNLYLDTLPKEQYLFVDVSLDVNKDLDFKFYLRNVDNKIDPVLFSLIESHYRKLRLFERMRLKSIEYISELRTKIFTFRSRLEVHVIIDNLIRAVDDDKKAYGDNHWKCILESTLLQSPIFTDQFN